MNALLTNTRILTRILFTLTVLSAATIGIGLLGLNIVNVSDRITDDMELYGRRALDAQRQEVLLTQTIADSRSLYSAQTPQEAATAAQRLQKGIDDLLQSQEGILKTVAEDRRAIVIERGKLLDEYVRLRQEIIRVAKSEGPARARELAQSESFIRNREDFAKGLEEGVSANREALIKANAGATAYYAETRPLLIGSLAAAILVAWAIAGAIVIFTITRPLGRMTKTMNLLAGGDTGVTVEGAIRKDEVGEMARAVQVFKDNMIARERAEADIAQQRRAAEEQRQAREARERRAIEEISGLCEQIGAGELDGRLNEADKDGFLLTISQRLNALTAMLQQITGEMARVTGGMAQGDMTNTIPGDYRGVFGRLKDSVNAMAAKLSDFAARLAESANLVKEASAEISTGSQDLAQRTESQAASIEETAASMHEITTTVKQNADNAMAANQLASAARDAADKGGHVMGDVVAAMQQIEGSAGKIADIVSLIDEIAFQTNLLALNASVEAARAGEAGKGFAVVAQEVRALAQRSAEASKDIKALISQSNAQVREGGKLVTLAGESLTEIVGSVKKVSDIVSEIAAASREQATGLDQINTAVGSMDEMTQRNGALVEETSASAQSLSEQASELARLVGFFRTNNAPVVAAQASARGMQVVSLVKPAAKTAAKPMAKPAVKHLARGASAASAAPATAAKDDDWQEF